MKSIQDSRLFADLHKLLKTYPEGIGEHFMLKELAKIGTINLEKDTFSNPTKLFRTHFFLYNALYQLRDKLWREARGHLEISVTRIKLLPYNPGKSGLAEHDPMRDYYLDLDMLEKTTKEDIDAALKSFWKRLNEETILSCGGLQEKALETLGLKQGCRADDIKIAYRRLAMRHHPDRGGKIENLQKINEAMEVLRPLLK